MTSDSIVANDAGETPRSDIARIATIAVAAFLSLLGAIRYGIHAETLVVVFVICALVVVSRHDLERRIIPNRIVLPAWIAVLLAHLGIHPHHWVEWLVASFGAALFFLVFALVYPAGLGMGDVKLALLIGADELSHSDRSLQPGRSSCCCSCRGSGVHSLNAKIGPSAHCLLRRTQRHFGVEGGKASARYCGLASSAEERSHSGRKLRCGGGLSRS